MGPRKVCRIPVEYGFRESERRLAILSCLWAWDVDIAILTERHLRDEDIFLEPRGHEGDISKRIFRIKMDNYGIAGWHNRESSEAYIGGGVLILAKIRSEVYEGRWAA